MNICFRGNVGPTLRLQFVPTITLLRTDFIMNNDQSPAPQDNANTTIMEIFDSITTAGAFTYFNSNSTVSITIDECRFINNSATLNSEQDSRPVLWKANGHGGAVLIRLDRVSSGSIQITNTLFERNKADIDGGGIYFLFTESFASNSVYLFNNTFRQNRAEMSAGGAISWNIVAPSYNNSLIVEDCDFIENHGDSAGAVSLTLTDTSLESFLFPDEAKFIRCLFERNTARLEGTAVGLFALVPVEEFGYPVDFVDW